MGAVGIFGGLFSKRGAPLYPGKDFFGQFSGGNRVAVGFVGQKNHPDFDFIFNFELIEIVRVIGFDLVRRDDDFFPADVFEFHGIDNELFAQTLAVGGFGQPLVLQRLDHADTVPELIAYPAFDLFVDVVFGQFVAGIFELIQNELALDQSFHGVRLQFFNFLVKLLRLPSVPLHEPPGILVNNDRVVHFDGDPVDGDRSRLGAPRRADHRQAQRGKDDG